MFIPYASVYTVSTSAASGLVWKCSLEGQHIFSITAARIVAGLRRFVAESFIGADGYRRRKGRNKDGSRFVHDCPRRDVSSRLGPSWRSGLGFRLHKGSQHYCIRSSCCSLLDYLINTQEARGLFDYQTSVYYENASTVYITWLNFALFSRWLHYNDGGFHGTALICCCDGNQTYLL